MGITAKEYARSLGVRTDWAEHAVWSGKGVRQVIYTYPSIHLGKKLRNECIRISTPNDLYVNGREHVVYKIPPEDLEWLESVRLTSVDIENPYSQMHNTKLEILLSPEMLIRPEEFAKRCEHLIPGLHADILDVIQSNEVDTYLLPEEAPAPGTSYKKFFDLHRVASARRTMMFSNDVKHYEPQGDQSKLICGLTGVRIPGESRVVLESVFVGMRPPMMSNRRGWIVFVPIDIFDQLYLTWLQNMVGVSFREHLRLYGLNVPTNGNAIEEE